jgi:hypothetical protein
MMHHYSVEDNSAVDFFAALKEMQQEDNDPSQVKDNDKDKDNDNDNDNDNDDSTCLITGVPLNAFHVELTCGHKFNYGPLYQEVLRQKGRHGVYNYFEKIGTHQVKCPYCRSITNRLLPYLGNIPHPTIKRLVGVNAPAAMCMPGVPCGAPKCSANAFYEFGPNQYCHRHYQTAQKAPAAYNAANPSKPIQRCAAENQTGKNKGNRCKLNATEGTTLCKIHAKCNIVMMTTTA